MRDKKRGLSMMLRSTQNIISRTIVFLCKFKFNNFILDILNASI